MSRDRSQSALRGYIGQFHDEIHSDGVHRLEQCLNRLEKTNWSLVFAFISITDVAIGDIFINEMPFLFKMKMFEILYHSVMSKVMLLIMRFRQDLRDQHKQDHQVLCSVDVIVIKEAARDSEWVASLKSVENILVLSNAMRLQVLYDFVIDMVGLIAIGELLTYLVYDLHFGEEEDWRNFVPERIQH